MKILSLDPSMTATGWAIVDVVRKQINSGCFMISKAMPKQKTGVSFLDVERARYLIQHVMQLISSWQPDHFSAEIPTGSINAGSAKTFGIMKGAIAGIIECSRIQHSYYLPTQVKSCLCNHIYADKSNIASAVSEFVKRYRFKLNQEAIEKVGSGKYKISLEAQFDAIAIAITSLKAIHIEYKDYEGSNFDSKMSSQKAR
jgi:Holliday junction resolvasome RuvABC endonuclease subunit